MTKQEFLTELRSRLSGLPKQELEERLSFYGEMIDDRIEEGYREKQAVRDIGTVEEISEQIIREIPLMKLAKARFRAKRRWSVWEILCLTLGSPIWLSLAIAAFAVILSAYAVVWSLTISLWAVFASFAACALGGTVGGAILALFENAAITGLACVGAGLLSAGLSILLFFGCTAATKGTLLLTKALALGVKKYFVRKEHKE